MANRAKWRVVELFDPREPRLPRFVQACRVNDHPWRVAWEHRDELESPLALWFRSLAGEGVEPLERTVLGSAVPLTEKTAHMLASFRICEVNRLATGDSDQAADFLLLEPTENVGRRGRPVVVIEPDGSVTRYPSVTKAADAEGISRPTVSRRLHRGLSGGDGRAAL